MIMTVTIIILASFLVILAAALAWVIAGGRRADREVKAPPQEAGGDAYHNHPHVVEPGDENPKNADRELFIRCCRYMELRKPFLVEGFSLEDLSQAMFTNKLYLSQTINSCTGKNFRNFVNNYRVMYAMELFRKNNRLRVSDLSNLSGFHTPVSFNMAFKLMMDEAPGSWCSRVRLQNQKHSNTK